MLIVVGSGERAYREYLLAGAAGRRSLWLLDGTLPTWQEPYIAGSTLVDPTDAGALVAAARQVHRLRPVAGVLCYDEALIANAAQVVAALDLPGSRPAAVGACRDKQLTRRRLATAGIAQPGSIVVANEAEARAAANRIGYPVVLKPRALGASQGVVKVDEENQLVAGYAVARAAHHPAVPTYELGVLVEEYLDGPEISVDAAFTQGRYLPLVLARKMLGVPPYFEEVGHLVDPTDPLLRDRRLMRMLMEAHRALGLADLVTHTEVRLTAAGPRIVEINARPGGDLIPYLGQLATGIDVGGLLADVVAGTGISLTPPRRRLVAGIRFLYPLEDCTVASMTLPQPGGALLEARPLASQGSELRLAPRGYAERYAALIAEGADRETCWRTLQAAAGLAQLQACEALPSQGSYPAIAGAPGTDER
jgi:biotin carboxylase